MLTATGQYTLTKYPYKTFINQVVSTSEAPGGYSHHPHNEKERKHLKKQKKTQRQEKQKQEPHWPKHETLTQGKQKRYLVRGGGGNCGIIGR